MELFLVDETTFLLENVSELMMIGSQKLEMKIRGNYTISFLKNIFRSSNIKKIIITDDNEKQTVIEGYNQISSIRINYNPEDLDSSIISIILMKELVS